MLSLSATPSHKYSLVYLSAYIWTVFGLHWHRNARLRQSHGRIDLFVCVPSLCLHTHHDSVLSAQASHSLPRLRRALASFNIVFLELLFERLSFFGTASQSASSLSRPPYFSSLAFSYSILVLASLMKKVDRPNPCEQQQNGK
jgi:hypothetical protein